MTNHFESVLQAALQGAAEGKPINATPVLDQFNDLQIAFNSLFAICQQLQTTSQFLQQKNNVYKAALVEIVHAYLTKDPQILRDVLEAYAAPSRKEMQADAAPESAPTGVTFH